VPLPTAESDDNQDETRKRTTDINEWDQKFITVDQEMLFEIILAANYLDIKSLLFFFFRSLIYFLLLTLQLKKIEHDMQTLTKEKTAATNFVSNLEKRYDWIQDESEYVLFNYLMLWSRSMYIDYWTFQPL
jgi:hypothetical protein